MTVELACVRADARLRRARGAAMLPTDPALALVVVATLSTFFVITGFCARQNGF